MRFMATKTNALIYLGLIFVAACVCMTSTLNPFSGAVPGTDSSVFMTIAQGMLRGKTPYLDFFDHKGPLIYFIDAAGLALGGFTGVWFLELFFMCVSVIFAYKTARFFGNGLEAFLGVIFSFISLTSFFEGGDLTEEYVLPFIFISLYIFIKYYFTGIEPSRLCIGITGACFGCSLLLRPNMFAVWVSFCSVIFVQKLARKDFRTLFRYMLFFILGFSAALLPVFAYLKITRALDECIRQYIDFNIRYSSSPVMVPATFLNFARSVYLAVNKSIVPLIVCVILLLRKPAAMRYGFCIAYTLSLGLSFFFIAISRTNFGHYYMVLIPFFVPAFTLCIPPLFQLFSSVKYAWIKYGGPLFALCLFFNLPILEWGHNVFWIVRSHDKHYFRQIGEFIGANTDDEDTVFVLGNRCQYYLFSGRGAASKYIYQFPLVSVVPEIYDELCSDLYSNKPAFIIVDSVRKNEQLASVFSLIDDEYYECFQAESGRYTIYKANGAKSATSCSPQLNSSS